MLMGRKTLYISAFRPINRCVAEVGDGGGDSLGGQIGAAEHHGAGGVAAAIGGAEAEGGEDAAGAGADQAVDAELFGDRRGVHRAGAAEGEEGEAARGHPALERDDAERAHHLLVGDADDPGGGLERVESQFAGERADGTFRRLGVEGDAAREGRVGGEVAEQQVGVGDRRLGATAAVTGGAGLGARRARAEPPRGAWVPPADPAAARAPRPPPLGSPQPIEPPPAPTVWTSTVGSWIGRPPIVRESVRRTAPSSTTQTSQEVPPMSKPSALPSPERRARRPAPTAPPAGPERTLQAPARAASSAGATPPEESITCGAGRPATSVAVPRRPRQRARSGG